MYGVISICLFFAVFIGVLVWALRLKKPYLNSMSDAAAGRRCRARTRTEPTPTPKIAMT